MRLDLIFEADDIVAALEKLRSPTKRLHPSDAIFVRPYVVRAHWRRRPKRQVKTIQQKLRRAK